MKRFLLILTVIAYYTISIAQIYEHPVFDRSDEAAFHITKVKITKDTTYVFCAYYAEAGSWASISKDTYLRDSKSHKAFPLLRCVGLPYSPETRNYSQKGSYELLFCFPSIAGIEQFDFIESDGERAFNVYGVSLKKKLKKSYTDTELKRISEMVSAYDSSVDTEKVMLLKDHATSLNNLVSYNVSIGKYTEAIRLGIVELEIREKVFGKEHPSYIVSLGNLISYYSALGNYSEAILLQMDATEVIKNTLGPDNISYIKSLGSLMYLNANLGNYDEAIGHGTEAMEIFKKVLGSENPDYAILSSHLAGYYLYVGNYAEAIRLQTEATEVLKKALGPENTNYAISLSNLALYNSKLGNYAKAIGIETEAMNIFKKVLGSRHPDYAMSLNNLATYNAYDGNYAEAVRLVTEAIDNLKIVLGSEHPTYATSLGNLALYNSKLGNNSKAIKIGTEATEILKKILGPEHPDYATSLDNLATYYSDYGNFSEALKLGTEAMEIRKRILGTEHPDYAKSLCNLAQFYYNIGNYVEAIKLGTEALEVFKKVLGTEHPDYAVCLNNLAGYYADYGNYKEAIKLWKESVEIRKKVLGTEHPDYATSLNNLATYYSDIGNFQEALRLGTEAMEIRKRVLGTENCEYAISLNNLATYSSDIGIYTEAIRLETEAMGIRKRVLGTEHPDYAKSLGNLAVYNSKVGNFVEAIRLGTEAKEIRKRVLGTEHPDYAKSLSDLAFFNANLGNYAKALRLETEAIEIRKSILGPEHPDYAKSLSNLAQYNYSLGIYTEATRLGTMALEIFKNVLGTKHPSYATSLSRLAEYNYDLGNYVEAIRLETEAMEIVKNVLGTEHPYYATSLNNLAVYYSRNGNISETIQFRMEATNIFRNVLGTGHPNYATSLNNLACSYYNCGNFEKAYYYLKQQIESSRYYVLYNLGQLSSNYKKSLWTARFTHTFFNNIPNFVSKYTNKESISELYNNTCLFAKGILLNTGIEMRKLILESKDSSLIQKYYALSTNINVYNKLIEKPIKERFMNTDSLNSIIQKQEMELARESKVYGDYTRNLTITWKEVQRNLEEGDIAIEYLDYTPIGTDSSTMYVALTLKKDYDAPHMVTLFETNQLNAIPRDDYYTRTNVSNLVWKPLEEELNGVKNIYFAPSGELHRIGIEYLPISKTENICDVYTLHRLSSTRQLAVIQDETEGKNSVLYGGLDYDEKSNVILTDSVSTKESILRSAFSRANVDSLSLRNSFEYLEGTKKEADMIAEDMKQHRVPYIYYSGIDGTEESFKKQDGARPKLMHIATHGFFLTEKEAEKSRFARPGIELMNEWGQMAGRSVEDKSMTRSGLLFSGCNHAIHHEHIPDGKEDGILTAQEISMLDLRGLDLVVLSACQTGLGDIVSGEGVFGLQRGFKKAGAKTIIMSLWNVNDESTMKMMTSFYHHYLEGMSKEEAFHTAQDELKKASPSQQERPDWAAFIMLDGIN